MTDSDNKNKWKSKWSVIKDLSEANKIWSVIKGYGIAFNPSKSTKVAIIQTFEKKNSSLRSIIRFDAPHKGANYPHINVNHRISGIRDPHGRLPPGALLAAKGTGYLFQTVSFVNNYILYPFSIAYELYRFTVAAMKDIENSTTRNTLETTMSFAGTSGGAFLGVVIGGIIGTAIYPGVGTIVGSFFGSVTGAMIGHYIIDVIVKRISNIYGYGIVTNACYYCGHQMMFYKYLGQQTNSYCGGDSCGHLIYKCKFNLLDNSTVYPFYYSFLHETHDTSNLTLNKDVNIESTRSMVERRISVVGTTGGGVLGALSGSLIGTALFPGIGSLIGFIVGTIAGAESGHYTVNAIAENIFDICRFGVVYKHCVCCGHRTKFKKYQGEQDSTHCAGTFCGSLKHKLYLNQIDRNGLQNDSLPFFQNNQKAYMLFLENSKPDVFYSTSLLS